MASSSCLKASSPPAEAPTPTMIGSSRPLPRRLTADLRSRRCDPFDARAVPPDPLVLRDAGFSERLARDDRDPVALGAVALFPGGVGISVSLSLSRHETFAVAPLWWEDSRAPGGCAVARGLPVAARPLGARTSPRSRARSA